MNSEEQYDNNRRTFLMNAGKLGAASVLLSSPLASFARQPNPPDTVTVQQVIDIIKKEVPDFNRPNSVDQIRSGRPDQVVTGIVTTMFPTIEVIEKTHAVGANMIIAHETPFFNNPDETDWLKDDDVYKYKVDLLNKYGIAIWRFHDHWHAHKPDGIAMGNLIKLGWTNYYDPQNPRMLTLPQAMTVGSIVDLAKRQLGISTVRLVGNLSQECKTVYLAFGYFDPHAQIPLIQKFKPDIILSGETREWETVERVRDGLSIGLNTNLLILSHSVSEEAGMDHAVTWLQPKVPGVKITHIPSNNPFQFL